MHYSNFILTINTLVNRSLNFPPLLSRNCILPTISTFGSGPPLGWFVMHMMDPTAGAEGWMAHYTVPPGYEEEGSAHVSTTMATGRKPGIIFAQPCSEVCHPVLSDAAAVLWLFGQLKSWLSPLKAAARRLHHGTFSVCPCLDFHFISYVKW